MKSLFQISTAGALLMTIGFLTSCSTPPKSNTAVREIENIENFQVFPLVGHFKAWKSQLPNGLKLVVIPDDRSKTIAVQTWFHVGSRDEVTGKTGLAHFFEHMMFKGTQKYPDGQFDAVTQSIGADGVNAYTSNDHTVYLQEVPSQHLEKILELESDRMTSLIINDQSFNTEREVVQNERRFRKENSPEGQIYELLFQTAFQNSAYRWPVIGYEMDLNLMTPKDAREFYQNFYHPEEATLILVGDVSPKKAYALIEKYYGKIQGRKSIRPSHPKESVQVAQRRKKIELNIENEKVWMGFKAPEKADLKNAEIEIIQTLLTDGRNSRLNRALIDSGIAGSVSSGSFGLIDQGLYVINANLQAHKNGALAESVILRELQKLKDQPVTLEELDRAKTLYRFKFLSSLETASGLARWVGESESDLGDLSFGMKLYDQIQKVTPESIQNVAQDLFLTQRMTLIHATPKAKE